MPSGRVTDPSRALRVTRVIVAEKTLVACVQVLESSHRRTGGLPGLVDAAVRLLPGLARHRCRNDADRDMLAELVDTQTAHLLEHVALEFAALAGSPRSLKGETRWDFARDGEGVYEIELEFDDDLVMLGALKAGVEFVSALVAGREPQGVEDAVVRLGRLRGLASTPPDLL